jgi:methylated-DNA-[protein]-cysteine S-methyltransferase
MSGIPPFHRQVYEEARRILPGRTRTYGELAHTLGKPGAARAVGQALGANPFALIVPCHRVLAAGGRLNGFSAHGGIHTKQRLLEIEGALPRTADSLF